MKQKTKAKHKIKPRIKVSSLLNLKKRPKTEPTNTINKSPKF